MLQGTSLPNEVAEQLDDMFEHLALESAAHSIKKQYEQLQSWQSKLQSSKEWPGDAHQQMHEILHRQFTYLLNGSLNCILQQSKQ